MIRKETFRCIGGFDEGNLKVSFNDVDLCLRIIRSGLKITFAPQAHLLHLESASRRSTDLLADGRFALKKKYFR